MRRFLVVFALLACCAPPRRPGDEAAWARFVVRGDRARIFARFSRYLESEGVGQVVPLWQLCRQGTDWDQDNEPFAIPPRSFWPNIVPTLRFTGAHVVPAVGRVEVISGFRTSEFNEHAGGAGQSRHLHFDAVDLVPLSDIDRDVLHRALLALWRGRGRTARMGLGLYGGTRFHVDTHRHRRW